MPPRPATCSAALRLPRGRRHTPGRSARGSAALAAHHDPEASWTRSSQALLYHQSQRLAKQLRRTSGMRTLVLTDVGLIIRVTREQRLVARTSPRDLLLLVPADQVQDEVAVIAAHLGRNPGLEGTRLRRVQLQEHEHRRVYVIVRRRLLV